MKRKQESVDSDGNQKKSKLELSETLTHQRLKIDELLSEIKPSEKKSVLVHDFLKKLQSELLQLKAGSVEHKLSDSSWLKSAKLPLNVVNQSTVKGTFKFHPIRLIQAMGSFALGTFNRRHGDIDIAVEMPQECFQDKDHLNARYLLKRAFFLAEIASALARRSDIIASVSYSHFSENQMKPVLRLKPAGRDLRHVTVVMHLFPNSQVFKLNRFHITKNNIRTSWYSAGTTQCNGKDMTSDVPTPHYNTWILSDVTLMTQLSYLNDVLGGKQTVKEGILLLKVWLHQRQLDQGFGCLNGFVLTMFVAYLVAQKKLNASMTNYQVFRKTLVEFIHQDWRQSGISLSAVVAAEGSGKMASCPSLADFHAAFDIVLVDVTGYVNICADMSAATYGLLKQEAALSIQYMESSSAFTSLFMTPVNFFHKYDQTFRLSAVGMSLRSTVAHLKMEQVVMDYCGDYVHACVPRIVQLLQKAFGERVTLVAPKAGTCHTWGVMMPVPTVGETMNEIWFGLLLDPQQVMTTHNLGPFGGTPEAEEFRALWKEKSELRRFPDGSIREAVVWPSDTLADRRMICSRIAKHILVSHAGFSKRDIHFMSNQLDPLLRPVLRWKKSLDGAVRDRDLVPAYGTGEEQHSAVIASCDGLGKLLHVAVSASPDLPLTINSVFGIAPVFRYAEVFPALAIKNAIHLDRQDNRLVPTMREDLQCPLYTPALTVVCMLEGSGKWPDDLDAIQRLKAAYYLSLSRALNKVAPHVLTAAFADHLNVYKDGYVFRVMIGCTHELVLHKSPLPADSRPKSASDSNENCRTFEYQYVMMPRLTSLLHGLQQQSSSYSGTVRLAKRWMAAQMLLTEHIDEEVIELLVASLFVTPSPYVAPGSPLVGFLRFLNLLSTHDWLLDPLIVNLNNELTDVDIADIQARFMKERSTLPLMFIATPVDRRSQAYTRRRPTAPILQRIALLASESRAILEQQLESGAQKADFKQIFRPPTLIFDAVVELNHTQLAWQHCAVDSLPSAVPRCLPYVPPKPPRRHDAWPVVEYDPAQLFISELQATFDDLAIFFYDKFGGSSIGIIWKPNAVQPQPFKVSHVNCRMPKPEDDAKEIQLVLNHEAILEDIRLMGRGLVKNIVVAVKSHTDSDAGN